MQRALQTTKSRASWKLCSGDSETQETDYSRIGSRQTKRDASFTTLDIPLKHGCKAATQPRNTHVVSVLLDDQLFPATLRCSAKGCMLLLSR